MHAYMNAYIYIYIYIYACKHAYMHMRTCIHECDRSLLGIIEVATPTTRNLFYFDPSLSQSVHLFNKQKENRNKGKDNKRTNLIVPSSETSEFLIFLFITHICMYTCIQAYSLI